MKLEKKHWVIIGVVIAVIVIWYFFFKKKKTESSFSANRTLKPSKNTSVATTGGCPNGYYTCGNTCCKAIHKGRESPTLPT